MSFEAVFICLARDNPARITTEVVPEFLGLCVVDDLQAANEKLVTIVSDRLRILHGDNFKGLISCGLLSIVVPGSLVLSWNDSFTLQLWQTKPSGWIWSQAECLGDYRVLTTGDVPNDLKTKLHDAATYIQSLEDLEAEFAEEKATLEHKLEAAYYNILETERICDLYRKELRNTERLLAETKQTLTIRTMECKLAVAAPTVYIAKPAFKPARTIIDELGEFNRAALRAVSARTVEPKPVVPTLVTDINNFDRSKLRSLA